MSISKDIIRNSIIIDSHLDLAMNLDMRIRAGEENPLRDLYLEDMKSGGINIVISSIFIDDIFLPERGLVEGLRQIEALMSAVELNSDEFMICKTKEDIGLALDSGKIGIMISFEGVEPLGNDIKLLRVFYELGVRFAGLTWSRRNYAASGSSFKPAKEGVKGGLSKFGVEIVDKSKELGIIIDVSHINDEGFWDVIQYTEKPIIASHSNCREIVDIPRNINDDQIIAIAKTGGIIGINSASFVVADTFEEATIKTYVDHIEYIGKLVGYEHVGIGLDMCDNLFKLTNLKSGSGLSNAGDTIKGYYQMEEIIDEMLSRGISETCIKKVIGENFLRLIYSEL